MPQFPGTIKSKLPKVGTTIFTTMTALANEDNAINLSQGFPDFEVNDKLKSLVTQYINTNNNQYAPMAGVAKLRESIAEKIEKLYSTNYNPDTEITITAGGTMALYSAISAIVNDGDEVVIFTPAYDSYTPAVQLNGGIPIYIPLKAADFSIPWDMVKKFINHRTRLIILNNPHNPTGATLSEDDVKQLQHILQGTEIMVLSDEVYEHLVFDGKQHESICRYPALAERSFVVFSFGKTYNATGWKVGYCIAPEILMKEFRKVHQYQTFSVNTPMQLALADYMEENSAYLQLAAFYEEKRNFFLRQLSGSKFDIKPAKGTYFQLLGYQNISEEKDTDLAIRLIKEFGVAAIPVSVFYHKPFDSKYLRFCFAKENNTLTQAAERLLKFAS
jgi:methionine aminotransferase